MSNLTRRILTGLAGGFVVVAAMLWHVYSFTLLFMAISLLTTYEFLHLLRQENETKAGLTKYLMVIMAIYVLAVSIHLWQLAAAWYVFIIPLILYFFISELFQRHRFPFHIIGRNIAAVFYTVLPFCLLIHLAYDGEFFEPLPVLGFFLLTWVYDIGAYFAGSAFGRHKLFERISPKKSWEGVAGGTLACAALAAGLSAWLKQFSLPQWLVIAGITVVFGTLGDLSESMLKRSLGVKDSGSTLPGHGGFLDRFDAILFNIPAIFTYMVLFTE